MPLTKQQHIEFSNAIEAGDVDTVEAFLKRHPEIIHHPDWTPPPLHCAVLWNQPAIAGRLLDHGADIEMLDPDRQTTPLRYAILFCKTDVIPLLLSRGANAGPLVENGTSAIQLAMDAANGKYKEFDDLPDPTKYASVVDLLHQSGLKE